MHHYFVKIKIGLNTVVNYSSVLPQVTLVMIHVAVYAAVFVTLAIIGLVAFLPNTLSSSQNDLRRHFPSEGEGSEEDDEDAPKVVIDRKRAFCQSVKFAMRLKRKMRRFKERKSGKLE